MPLCLMYGLAVLAPAFLSPLSPEMLKTHLHVDMCPNITAVTNASLSPSNSGYAMKAAKDSGNGMFSFLGALAAGCVADKVVHPLFLRGQRELNGICVRETPGGTEWGGGVSAGSGGIWRWSPVCGSHALPDMSRRYTDEQEGSHPHGLARRDDAVPGTCAHVRQRLLHSPVIAEVCSLPPRGPHLVAQRVHPEREA